jgi:hypothetical protein
VQPLVGFQELTKLQYNRSLGREGSLMPADVESTVEIKPSVPVVPAQPSGFFGPPFYPKQVFFSFILWPVTESIIDERFFFYCVPAHHHQCL